MLAMMISTLIVPECINLPVLSIALYVINTVYILFFV